MKPLDLIRESLRYVKKENRGESPLRVRIQVAAFVSHHLWITHRMDELNSCCDWLAMASDDEVLALLDHPIDPLPATAGRPAVSP